mgnify:CR=1 FL=1
MGKILVAYFSATGVTKELAEKLANVAGADLHEIKSKTEYTSADLDWTDKDSRSSIFATTGTNVSVLFFDKSATTDKVILIDASKLGEEYQEGNNKKKRLRPFEVDKIVNTFLESYDLQGKTIIPVATSGGSGMGNTNKELAVSCKGAVLKKGRIFSKSVSESDLKAWIDTAIN